MFVVKINKSVRNGNIIHYLLILDDEYIEEDIDYAVSNWCDQDGAGRIYGYSYKWEVVTDELIIKDTLDKKLKSIDDSIISLEKNKQKILNYLNPIKTSNILDNVYNITPTIINYKNNSSNSKVPIKRGCSNTTCFCDGKCNEIIAWRDKLPNEL